MRCATRSKQNGGDGGGQNGGKRSQLNRTRSATHDYYCRVVHTKGGFFSKKTCVCVNERGVNKRDGVDKTNKKHDGGGRWIKQRKRSLFLDVC